MLARSATAPAASEVTDETTRVRARGLRNITNLRLGHGGTAKKALVRTGQPTPVSSAATAAKSGWPDTLRPASASIYTFHDASGEGEDGDEEMDCDEPPRQVVHNLSTTFSALPSPAVDTAVTARADGLASHATVAWGAAAAPALPCVYEDPPRTPGQVSPGEMSEAIAQELQRLREENEHLRRQAAEGRGPKHLRISSEMYSVRHGTVTEVRLARSASLHTQAVLTRLSKGAQPARSSIAKNMITLLSSSDTHRPQYRAYLASRQFARDLVHLASRAAKLFAKEERLVMLSSPVYIFGDIHGNLADLRFFSHNLWRFGMKLTAGKFLFLGDYVDRGQQSLEVVALLFALKIQNPGKIFLLRGNHELRKVNGWEEWYKSRSFLWQCKHRFGDSDGAKVWEHVNRTFDCLPFAAVVDDSIFCCHGGIPRPLPGMTHSPAECRHMRSPLRTPPVGGRPPRTPSTDSDVCMALASGEASRAPRLTGTTLLGTPKRGAGSWRHHDRRLEAIRAIPVPIRLDGVVHDDTVSHAATVADSFSADAAAAAQLASIQGSQGQLAGGGHTGGSGSRGADRLPSRMSPATHQRWAKRMTPDRITQVALDMMWADPAPEDVEGKLGADGFGPGLRGGDTVVYGNHAIEEFLEGNGLQLIVRAHQAISTGVGISKSARVFTVFSTSKDHGCGATATCGCLLVEDGQVLPIMREPPGLRSGHVTHDDGHDESKQSRPVHNGTTVRSTSDRPTKLMRSGTVHVDHARGQHAMHSTPGGATGHHRSARAATVRGSEHGGAMHSHRVRSTYVPAAGRSGGSDVASGSEAQVAQLR